jgi:DNA invertase Pin-like site-specific DNA recombinase
VGVRPEWRRGSATRAGDKLSALKANSLDAQREACEAYIKSQAHEGWRVIDASYADGGFSGGNMERPSLKRLIEDVGRHRVDVVVVTKSTA